MEVGGEASFDHAPPYFAATTGAFRDTLARLAMDDLKSFVHPTVYFISDSTNNFFAHG